MHRLDVSSILDFRKIRAKLVKAELTLGEKRVKHRPHQSNQNRIVPALREGSTLRIALKCFHTIFATALP